MYDFDGICFLAYAEIVVEVLQHPEFTEQYIALTEIAQTNNTAEDLVHDITALWTALEDHGHAIEGEHPDDASHPIVTSRYQTFALRRTPPTPYTPYAVQPPILRIPYVWFVDVASQEEVAVLMLIGDKTEDGNLWYPKTVRRIEEQLVPTWIASNPKHSPRERRPR